jgi:hypothetical protein
MHGKGTVNDTRDCNGWPGLRKHIITEKPPTATPTSKGDSQP